MKKLVCAFILSVFLLLLTAATVYIGETEIILYNGGKEVFHREYKIKASLYLNVLLGHKNSYANYYEKNADKKSVKDFSCINDRIYPDIMNAVQGMERMPSEGKIHFGKDGFSYTAGKDGIACDYGQLEKSMYHNFGKVTKINLRFYTLPAKDNPEKLLELTSTRSEFGTGYRKSCEGRKHNIALAADKFDGLTVQPNQTISFNEIVGPRSIANGFREAKIIKNGVFTEGIGGGVCQVSTTLFNAWLRAGLKVIKRSNHSLPVSYVAPSLDAMVSSETDLVLYNDSPYCVYISCKADGEKIIFTVYGQRTDTKIRLRSVILKTIPGGEYEIVDKELDWREGETERILSHPKNGLISEGFIQEYADGVLVRERSLGLSCYKPQKGQKAIRKPPPASENGSEMTLSLIA